MNSVRDTRLVIRTNKKKLILGSIEIKLILGSIDIDDRGGVENFIQCFHTLPSTTVLYNNWSNLPPNL